MTTETYTIYDVLAAECNLWPLECVWCGSREVVVSIHQADAICQDCGRWQLDEDEEDVSS